MDSFSTIVVASIAGMGMTMALLALLALIFHAIGKFGKRGVLETQPDVAKKEGDISSVLPFIATAVYLYMSSEIWSGSRGAPRRAEGVAKPPLYNTTREEWKRCGRRNCMR